MPVIARFYGILIKLYFNLPARALRLVNEWAGQYKHELSEMWSRQEFRQLPGLE